MRNLWIAAALLVLIVVATVSPSADAAPTGVLTATVYTLPISFPEGGAAMINGNIITQVGSIRERKIWEYNTDTGDLIVVHDNLPTCWRDVSTCSVPTANAGVAYSGKVLYLTGGATTWYEDNPSSEVRRYDPTTKRVTTAIAMNEAYIDGTTAWDPVRRRVVLFAGANGVHYLDSLRAYDPERGTFATLPGKFPRTGDNMCAVYVPERDSFVVGGGHSSGKRYNDFYEMQPSGASRLIGTLPYEQPLGANYPACHVYHGQLIVAGGDLGGEAGFGTAIYAMDIVTGAVQQIGTLPMPYAGYSYVGDGANLWLLSGGRNAMRVVLE